ncbi:MAG: hypothetical protein JO353_14070 [Phycisphaerae bacterium]|nr:hypothetical protein [Phycisphaerae bacterium]
MQSHAGGFSRRRIQRWARHNLTRENFIQSLKTLAWVCPLTVLIWVYAEREQLKTDSDVTLPIMIRSDNPERVVTLQRPYPEKVVVASLSGSRENLDKVAQALQHANGEDASIQIAVDPQLPPGPHEVVTAAALANVPLFKRNGVTVSDCSPAVMVVNVDTLTEQDVPVQVPPDVSNVVSQAVFTPATVKVRGAATAMKEGKLTAYADLTGLDALKQPGEHSIPGVRIRPLDDKALTFLPTEVKAQITVRESDVPYVARALILWVVGPADIMSHYRVECGSQVVPSVTIMGPPERIAQLERPDFTPKPRAVLEIRPSDDPGKPLRRQPRVELPPDMGLHVVDENAMPQIDFRLIDTRGSE